MLKGRTAEQLHTYVGGGRFTIFERKIIGHKLRMTNDKVMEITFIER